MAFDTIPIHYDVNEIFAINTYLMQIPKKFLLFEFYQYSIAILSLWVVLLDYPSDIEYMMK